MVLKSFLWKNLLYDFLLPYMLGVAVHLDSYVGPSACRYEVGQRGKYIICSVVWSLFCECGMLGVAVHLCTCSLSQGMMVVILVFSPQSLVLFSSAVASISFKLKYSTLTPSLCPPSFSNPLHQPPRAELELIRQQHTDTHKYTHTRSPVNSPCPWFRPWA